MDTTRTLAPDRPTRRSPPVWRVAVLARDPATRSRFERAARGDAALTLAASFDTLAGAARWCELERADVLLFDVALADAGGLALIAQQAARRPDCEALVLSQPGDEQAVLDCMASGAVGQLDKSAQPHELLQVVRDVKRGAASLSPLLVRRLLMRYRTLARGAQVAPVPPPAEVALSRCESKVLDLIARGYSYAEIARLTSVTVHTVQSHIKNLYGKLSVHSRTEAVFEASRMGLLPGLAGT
jgi:DNA-binding NarL/FixJ family response regulator